MRKPELILGLLIAGTGIATSAVSARGARAEVPTETLAPVSASPPSVFENRNGAASSESSSGSDADTGSTADGGETALPVFQLPTGKNSRGSRTREKETDGTEAPNRFEADTVIKSRYQLNGESLEVDPD